MRTYLIALSVGMALSFLFHISIELHDSNKLREKELMLKQMEIISTQCDSKSGSVDFEKGDLKCDEKKPEAGSSAKFKQMPNQI